MSTWTGPGTWEALGKGNYPWIPRTALNFPATGSLRSLEKRAVRWDPEDAQDLDPWSQGRRYSKEQEERGGMWNGANGSMEMAGAASSCHPSRMLCLPLAGSAIPGGQSQDCRPLAAGMHKPSDQLSTRPLGSSPRRPSPLHRSPFLCLSGLCRVSHG